jgi:hypothetical protein
MNKKFRCPACLSIINHVFIHKGDVKEITVDKNEIIHYKIIRCIDSSLFECSECGKVIAHSEEELLEVIKDNSIE